MGTPSSGLRALVTGVCDGVWDGVVLGVCDGVVVPGVVSEPLRSDHRSSSLAPLSHKRWTSIVREAASSKRKW